MSNAAVEYRTVPLTDLYEDTANARLHPVANLTALRASLRRFGQVEPLVVQKSSGRVIGGNGRLTVLRELGWEQVDVALLDCDDAQALALAITLNRTAELAEWDTGVLTLLLQEIAPSSDADLDTMLANLAAEIQSDLPVPVETPVAPVTAPTDFQTYGEDIPTDHLCPKCGYRFSGGQTVARETEE